MAADDGGSGMGLPPALASDPEVKAAFIRKLNAEAARSEAEAVACQAESAANVWRLSGEANRLDAERRQLDAERRKLDVVPAGVVRDRNRCRAARLQCVELGHMGSKDGTVGVAQGRRADGKPARGQRWQRRSVPGVAGARRQREMR